MAGKLIEFRERITKWPPANPGRFKHQGPEQIARSLDVRHVLFLPFKGRPIKSRFLGALKKAYRHTTAILRLAGGNRPKKDFAIAPLRSSVMTITKCRIWMLAVNLFTAV
jgi:hypothetical protein